jgi:hypothetical protein
MSNPKNKSVGVIISGKSLAFVKQVESMAKQTASKVAKVASVGADKAISFKTWVDRTWAEGVDDLYELHRQIAVENLARLRAELPAASPHAIREHLGAEYRAVVFDDSIGADLNLSATKLLVLSLAEVHGDRVKSIKGKRRLVAQVLLATSTPVVFVVRNAPFLWEFILILVSAITKSPAAKAGGAAAKAGGAAAKAGGAAAKAGGAAAKAAQEAAKRFAPKLANRAIKLEGVKKFVVDSIFRYAVATLGPAPKTWPLPKTAPAKKPAATKTVTRKAVPKKKPAA